MKRKNNNKTWALIFIGIVFVVFMARMGWLGGTTIDPWVYDLNDDCYISQEEVSYATNDYLSGSINILDLSAVSNQWETTTRNPSCPPITCMGFNCPLNVWVYIIGGGLLLVVGYYLYKKK